MRRILAIALVAACSGSPAPAPSAPPPPRAAASDSNIARADYVGPETCGECHAEQYGKWSHSLHRVMNARATPNAVIGDFAGAVVAYGGGTATFTRDRDGFAMTLARGGASVRYRVTRTIGRRGLQEYVGIADGAREEVRLPFGWWPRRGGWFPQPYYDPWLGDEAGFDAYAEVTAPWAERCPWCHSTYPFAQRIARAAGPRGLGHGLEQRFVGEAPPDPERLDTAQQITVGISCESCHLGGRAHVAGGAITFVPRGAPTRDGAPAMPAAFADERRDADVVDAVCAQCHSGPSPRLADGTALRNSSEAIDLAASPCRGIRCTDCHDPHRADARSDEARAIAACTGCHAALADAATARA
ncbi:MAG TPA: cytochrome c3 family protein, partial [Kofleriaceae bacterium]|nr:cytochrome c3 family protein [Kofleriaceae bacterium]